MAKCKYPDEICASMTLYHGDAYCASVPCSLKDELPPLTNADRIRGMDNEELAIALHTAFSDGVVYSINGQRGDFSGAKKESDYLKWLQQPYKEDMPCD